VDAASLTLEDFRSVEIAEALVLRRVASPIQDRSQVGSLTKEIKTIVAGFSYVILDMFLVT
jgi:hypothetical protein